MTKNTPVNTLEFSVFKENKQIYHVEASIDFVHTHWINLKASEVAKNIKRLLEDDCEYSALSNGVPVIIETVVHSDEDDLLIRYTKMEVLNDQIN